MPDIVAFLKERIDEEEEIARRAAFGWGAEWKVKDPGDDWACIAAEGSLNVASSEDIDVIRHACRWDPARVLAEIAAKRAILAADPARGARSYLDDVTAFALAAWERTLLVLVQPFASHPDFDPAWESRADGS